MKWNYNLLVTYVFRISFSVSQGVWNSGTGSNYIYYLEGRSNTRVGVIQAIQGLAIPLASLPGGCAADAFRRDAVLRVFGAAGFVAIALSIAAVLAPKEPLPGALAGLDWKYGLLCVAFCFWGVAQAGNQVVESVLADSVQTGSRSAVYTSLFFLGMLGRAVGPLMAAVVFIVSGNRWSVRTLGTVVMVGMLLSVLPIASLFAFNDDRLLGAESEAHGLAADAAAATEEEGPKGGAAGARGRRRLCGLTPAAIPYILATADLVYGLASGCTIKFFPVFFAEEVGLAPVAVNCVMAGQPLMIAAFSILGQRLSAVIGRIEVLLLLRLAGWAIMAVMGLFPAIWRHASFTIVLYLIRTGVNNAGYPLQKGVLMDHVPKSQRGRWSAFDSVCALGWSGSALIGGLIVDRAGFDWCFMITAAAQCLGWAVMFPLLALVPRQEAQNEAAAVQEGVREPLLPPEAAASCSSDGPGLPPAPGEIAVKPRTGESKEFVPLAGSLKSPRQSMDAWPGMQ